MIKNWDFKIVLNWDFARVKINPRYGTMVINGLLIIRIKIIHSYEWFEP